jgi:hypothetical protein
LYNLAIENISLNAFLSSFLVKYLLENLHSFSSNPDAILNDGIVRPIFFSNKQNLMIEYNEYNTIEEERGIHTYDQSSKRKAV